MRYWLNIILLGCLVGGSPLAQAGVANFIDGGYTYYYDSVEGNTPANPKNTLGRPPTKLRNYEIFNGYTNVVYVCYEDSIGLAENWALKQENYTSGYSSKTISDLAYALEDGRCVFAFPDKSGSTVPPTNHPFVTDPGTFTGARGTFLYFRNDVVPEGTEALKGALQVYFVGRSDGYYRVPRSDTYYVVPGAKLWFLRPQSDTNYRYAGSRWVDDNGSPLVPGQAYTSANWTWTYDGGFDKFVVTAPAGSDFTIPSEGNRRTLTVHVVNPATFSYREYDIRFNGRETRSLMSLFFLQNIELLSSEIESVTSSDNRISVVSTGTDWKLTATADFDNDCEVTVKLAGGRGIILLKIVTMPGKLLSTLISQDGPERVDCQMDSLILGDDGLTYVQGPVWTRYPNSVNVPPGYTNVWRNKDCVLYLGKRYSVCFACDRKGTNVDSLDNTETYTGYLRGGLRMNGIYIFWLEDENARKAVLPQVFVVDVQRNTNESMYFGKGRDNKLYNSSEGLTYNPYAGMIFTVARQRDDGNRYFMGTTVDEYGYYVMRERNSNPINWEEWSVIGIGGLKPILVKKEIVGEDDGTEFRFRAVYTDYTFNVVTNFFTLHGGEDYTIMANTNAAVTVTEVFSGNYRPSVKGPDDTDYHEGNELEDGGREEGSTFYFLGTEGRMLSPKSIWIADHFDAGANKVHLALAMDFGVPNFAFEDWLTAARTRGVLFEKTSTNACDFSRQPLKTVTDFRNGTGAQDVAKNWVWVTADVADENNSAIPFYRQYFVDTRVIGYSDEIIRSTLPVGSIERFETADGVGYSISNVTSNAEITFTRPSRYRSLLLVGGGAAGGGALGGGGGGGEVRTLAGSELGTIGFGDTIRLSVGAGGVPPADDVAEDVKSQYNPIWNSPGANGHNTLLTIGTVTYMAHGGGGGGSRNSYVQDSAGKNGRGMDGANSGGNAGLAAASRGVPTVAGGHQGGLGAGNAGDGAGGGGGATADGANGTKTQSGAGGEGRYLVLGGTASGVYGAGGGAGGDSSSTQPGAGGTNAGTGGRSSTTDASLCVGGDAVPGFGGGGGGGAHVYVNNTYKGYRGGAGGCGRIVLLVRDASAFDCVSGLVGAGCNALTVACNLLALADGQTTAQTYFSCVPEGEPANYSLVNESLAVGASVTNQVSGLAAGTVYSCRYKFVAPNGTETVVEESVRTASIDYATGFADENLIVSAAGLGPNGVQVSSDGTYTLVFTNVAASAQFLANNDLTLVEALVVGGGGGGGSGTGGGGGGGEVRSVSGPLVVPMGTIGRISIGAGGAGGPQSDTSPATGKAGGETRLVIGNTSYVAVGGGFGGAASNKNASFSSFRNGGAGANGGGAGGLGGTPGASTVAGGYPGGCGEAEKYDGGGCAYAAGGGGGAGAPGQDSYSYIDSNVENYQAGNGGEGISSAISGLDVVYGSGGGGGQGNYYKAHIGLGGTNAGNGGYNGKGTNGRVGTGAGGGGGGGQGSTYHAGGAGGCGAVILKLKLRPVNAE